MENPSVANLRSRSRSKTPLPPQSEVENGPESNERPNSKAGRKTPNKISRDTPTKLIPIDVEVINEDEEPPTFTSPPAHRTRNATRQKQPPEPASLNSEPTIVSEYSFEEADILSHPGNSFMTKETAQNIRNYSYEYERRTSRLVNTSSSGGGGGGLALWSSSAGGGSRSASRLQGSPSGSDRSNESFAESVLADSSRVSVEGTDHLPYRLYKSAIEYWNKYPKTDYTYSRLSKDRVELAPGQVAVPNMSRPSLGRVARSAAGDMVQEAYQSSTDLGLHRRWNNVDRYENLADSDYDSDGHGRLSSHPAPSSTQHWWITSLLISIVTTVTSITSSLRDRILPRDPSRRYPYYSTNTAAYRTNTYTKETTWMSSAGKVVKKRKWWILIPLLLLLPLLLVQMNPEYKEKITSINLPDNLIPDFSQYRLSLPELYMPAFKLPNISMPEFPKISLPEFSMPNITLPDFSIPKFSLPDFKMPEFNLPELSMIKVDIPEFQFPASITDALYLVGEYIMEFIHLITDYFIAGYNHTVGAFKKGLTLFDA